MLRTRKRDRDVEPVFVVIENYLTQHWTVKLKEPLVKSKKINSGLSQKEQKARVLKYLSIIPPDRALENDLVLVWQGHFVVKARLQKHFVDGPVVFGLT